MFTTTFSWADFKQRRSSVDAVSILIVLVLSLVFAATISAAMTLRPIADPVQASIEGGL